MRLLIAFFLVFAAAAALRVPAYAGTTGGVRGYVYQFEFETVPPSRPIGPIAKAKVTAIGIDGMISTFTDRSGFFVFISLSPGKYFLYVEHEAWECPQIVYVTADQVGDLRIPLVVWRTTQRIIDHCGIWRGSVVRPVGDSYIIDEQGNPVPNF